MDLSTATVDDLIAELRKRFAIMVFAGVSPAANTDPNRDDDLDVRISGGVYAARGLARSAEEVIASQCVK